MVDKKIFAGLDIGHVNTKLILMEDSKIIYYWKEPTRLDPVASIKRALNNCLNNPIVSSNKISGVVATGIFKDLIKEAPVELKETISEHEALAKGAIFLEKNSRIVIDFGGNISKVIRYDQEGNLLDVVENDKCADGIGIFFKTMAKVLGMDEEEISNSALKSKRDLSVAIQCGLSAASDALDLIANGNEISDVGNAILKFIAERIYSMCTYMPVNKEVVVAGEMAKSKALIKHLSNLMKQELKVLNLPEYVGAIGSIIYYRGKR